MTFYGRTAVLIILNFRFLLDQYKFKSTYNKLKEVAVRAQLQTSVINKRVG